MARQIDGVSPDRENTKNYRQVEVVKYQLDHLGTVDEWLGTI